MARDQRRLAAIVSLDVAGYSRLMGVDDSGTLAALKAHRRELIDPKIAEHEGRIVKTTGDGLLLEFSSVVDAVRCAVEVQRGMAERNAGVVPDKRLDFRIGINVGDIIIDGDDIFGDGVNVAARLEALADPGDICVSKVVRDQVLDKLSFTFEDLGPREMKNIARPIEVYRVRDDPRGATKVQEQRPSGHRGPFSRSPVSRRRSYAGAGAAIAALGVAAWYVYVQPRPAPTSGPPPLSVAVMPFAPATASADDESFAERLTLDMTSALQRSGYARVASHGLAATYRGKAIDARAVGRELNVRYLVEGDVRRDAPRVAISVRMVDATDGTQVWNATPVAPPVSGGNGGTADLVTGLSSGVRAALLDAEKKRITRLPGVGANAMELVLQAWAAFDKDPSTLKGALAQRKLFEEALRLDPGLATAMVGLCLTITEELRSGPGTDDERLIRELDEWSARAIQADRNDPLVWLVRSDALQSQSKFEGAFEANAEALRIDPDRIGALNQQAWLLLATGRAEEALPVVDRAIALDPRSVLVSDLLHLNCRAHLLLGHYDDAIAACEKANARFYWWVPTLYLIAAYAQKGDMSNAAAAKEEVLRRQPGYTISRLKQMQKASNHPTFVQQRETHLYPGLRKAGIPEQ